MQAYGVARPPSARAASTMVCPSTDIVERVNAEKRCVLTIHAHPDDEASKGAPTLAKYKQEGAHTVLVCCTGGEEGDLQNPALREPGQPFHDLTPEQEKAKMAELRPGELAASAAVIGFDEVIMLGYRDSGMVDSEANKNPECFHMAPLDEAVGRLVAEFGCSGGWSKSSRHRETRDQKPVARDVMNLGNRASGPDHCLLIVTLEEPRLGQSDLGN